jgi:mannose-6-phosphate isomerase-like protein (cupin superfamily)
MQRAFTGNANVQPDEFRSWLVGHFIPESLGPRSSGDVEIKWVTHKAGQERSAWITNEKRTTFTILISGQVDVYLRIDDDPNQEQKVELRKQGDFLSWGKGTGHLWRCPDRDAVLLTVRWPSVTTD